MILSKIKIGIFGEGKELITIIIIRQYWKLDNFLKIPQKTLFDKINVS